MSHSYTTLAVLSIGSLLGISACGSSSNNNTIATQQDIELREMVVQNNITGDPTAGRVIPSIHDPLPQLGKKLFFSKGLGGGFDAACASCHHPTLGGGDDLSLSIGVDADNPDQLGIGRSNSDNTTPVPRNAPTTFNIALWDRGLFWDSRVEALSPQAGLNGASGGIRTPDSNLGVIDNSAGDNLVEAQAKFPVTSDDEMKTQVFEAGSSNSDIQDHLAARIGDYGIGQNELSTNTWLGDFQSAFVSSETAESLITYDNIAKAIGEYERSQIFINSPWKAFVEGDANAISEDAKMGANLFFSPANQGGAGCVACHTGDLFSDEQFHVVGFPQIGPGKGDGVTGDEDYGRGRETLNINDRYRFRTASLLNVEMTAPYTHAGAFDNLEDVVRHYVNPQGSADTYFNNSAWCDLPQFTAIASCGDLFDNAQANTQNALNQLNQERRAGTSRLPIIRLDGTAITQIVAFLKTLTDPCTKDRSCLADWIPDTSSNGPDNQQLNARDVMGNLL